MTTLDDVMVAAIDFQRGITNDDISRFIAVVEQFADEQVAEDRTACAMEFATKIAQFQFCIDRVAEALGNVCCGGIDSSPADQMADPHSTTRVLVDAAAAIRAERDTLLSAAELVVWFDWSDCDTDACEAMDRLRDACDAIRARGNP